MTIADLIRTEHGGLILGTAFAAIVFVATRVVFGEGFRRRTPPRPDPDRRERSPGGYYREVYEDFGNLSGSGSTAVSEDGDPNS